MSYHDWTMKRMGDVINTINALEKWVDWVAETNESAYTDSILKSAIDELTDLYDNNIYDEAKEGK